MTTSVKVTAHNFPVTVTVTQKGDNYRGKQTYKLADGQEGEYTVTDSQSVKVEERIADREHFGIIPHGEN